MKKLDFEYKLIKAAPSNSTVDTLFTDKVMRHITLPSLDSTLKSSNRSNKKTLLFRLRHLPKFAMIILAIVILFTISGVTYAIVETVRQLNVKVDQSGVNEFGREQLSVTFDSCAKQKENGTTYELKKDSGLSTEDGAKVLEAKCERDTIATWIKEDPTLSSSTTNPSIPHHEFMELRISGFVGTFQGLSDEGIAIHSTTAFTSTQQDQTLPFPNNARVIEDGKEVAQGVLKPGDTILYFSPGVRSGNKPSTGSENVVVFKLSLDAKYYSLDMESYIRPRQPCLNNEAHTCVVSNHINMVHLLVSNGGTSIDTTNTLASKSIQGKVVSWNNREIRLDVGKGAIYTFRTPLNIINTYNTSTVYGLKSFDTIYSKTDPEALKISVGDSLEIMYQEVGNQSSQVIEWSQTGTIALMVERTVQDLSVLRKY